jgi:hypothetical protein
MMGVEPDVVVPFTLPRIRLGAATEARSTLITLSIDAVRGRGRLRDYSALLPRHHREEILSSVAGTWMPMRVAFAHYEAVEALGFTTVEATEIGRAVGDRINGTFLGTMVRMASTAGMTPWFILSNTGKLYERMFRGGGGISVTRYGPKDAHVDVVGLPLVSVPYFRAAMRGMFQAACELVSRRVYVRDVPHRGGAGNAALRISWV